MDESILVADDGKEIVGATPFPQWGPLSRPFTGICAAAEKGTFYSTAAWGRLRQGQAELQPPV